MAHGFVQSFAPEWEVRSAGTRPASQVNALAIEAMREVGIDISSHTPKNVTDYLDEPWDYVITVCGGANETCPTFVGNVGHRLHIGFDDPSDAIGSHDHVMSEFRRVRNEIRIAFSAFCTERQ